jgi:hypothetical protein
MDAHQVEGINRRVRLTAGLAANAKYDRLAKREIDPRMITATATLLEVFERICVNRNVSTIGM